MNPPPTPPHLRANLWLEAPTGDAATTEFACRLQFYDGETQRIWFRFPAATAQFLTRTADPFVIATLLYSMRRCRELVVHGPMSGALLSNLSDFQEAFCAYHVGQYHPVQIVASHIAPDAVAAGSDGAISAFSGGVDGTFSLFRHTARSTIAPKRPLRAALLMLGMDLSIGEEKAFARVAEKCAAVALDAGIPLFTGATNVRQLPLLWDDQFGTAVAASLMFFQERYSQGLIASAYAYGRLHLDHGSNPLTDPLLSSGRFGIVHDGSGYGRIDKLRGLATWPTALARLRVCWQPGRSDNCGQCEKCIRTQLMLDLCGVEHRAAFPRPMAPEALANLSISTTSGMNELEYLLQEARLIKPDAPWTGPLARAIARNRRYLHLRTAARGAGSIIPGWLRLSAGAAAKRLFAQDNGLQKPAPHEPPAGTPISKASL